MDIKQIMSKVNEILPPQPTVKFTVVKAETGLFDNKIGGTPYFPKDMEYPTGKDNGYEGQPLTLLAQLNFEKLPHIPDFPEKGILQFFIAGDDMYGMSSECYGESLMKQDNFRVIYHENIITDESKLLSPGEIPKYSGDDEETLPFTGEYLLSAPEKCEMPANDCDYRFGDVFVKCYNEVSDEPINSFWDIDEETFEALNEDNEAGDAFIGGYPVFTQSDPREDDEVLSQCDVVLFELDSCDNSKKGIDIMWGDAGTGCFLISRDRLKALDFSRVIYNYDCC